MMSQKRCVRSTMSCLCWGKSIGRTGVFTVCTQNVLSVDSRSDARLFVVHLVSPSDVNTITVASVVPISLRSCYLNNGLIRAQHSVNYFFVLHLIYLCSKD